MKYIAELKPKAVKDLKNIPKPDRKRIVEKLKLLAPEYIMRVGDW